MGCYELFVKYTNLSAEVTYSWEWLPKALGMEDRNTEMKNTDTSKLGLLITQPGKGPQFILKYTTFAVQVWLDEGLI